MCLGENSDHSTKGCIMTQSLQSGSIKYQLTSGARRVVEVALQKSGMSTVRLAPSSALLEALVQEVEPSWHAALVMRSYGIESVMMERLPEGDCRAISDILYWAHGEANRSFFKANDVAIATEHLLMALVAQHDPTATLLNRHGMYVDKVRELLNKMSGPVTASIAVVG